MNKKGYKRKNRIGEKFGRLTIISYPNIHLKNVKKNVECECECGNKTIIQETSVISGKTKSCGCFKTEVNKSKGDGHSKTKLYRVYYGMKSRCLNQLNSGFKNYGGRGITICDDWKNDYKAFYAWAVNNGWEIGLEIDRIDNNGNYEPSNCRFVTKKQNDNNRRSTILITYNGQTKTITEWAAVIGIKESTLRSRLQERKLSIEEAMQTKKLYKGLLTTKRFYNK